VAHEVKLKLNTNVVGYKDIEIVVRQSSGKLGTLLVSRGNIEWRPAWKSVKKHRFTWQEFAERMQEGKPVKTRRSSKERPRTGAGGTASATSSMSGEEQS
jgi:hypothetical protein